MPQHDWEKSPEKPKNDAQSRSSFERLKFLIGGVLILGAVGYLMLSGTVAGARYFINVDELLADESYIGQNVQVAGAVIGDTIEYDSRNGTIRFTVADVADEYDDIGQALHEAANNPDALTLNVYIENTVKPDLLQHEAQAIMSGKLGEDGIFYVSDLKLRCPSRFAEGMPTDLN